MPVLQIKVMAVLTRVPALTELRYRATVFLQRNHPLSSPTETS
jgi:hypothetical protein